MTRCGLWISFVSSLFLASSLAQNREAPSSNDWLTWGGDSQRTGWAKSENTLTKDNVSGLGIKWKTQLDTVPKFEVLSTLTAPLVIEGVSTGQGTKDVVVVVGSDENANAFDAETAERIWR